MARRCSPGGPRDRTGMTATGRRGAAGQAGAGREGGMSKRMSCLASVGRATGRIWAGGQAAAGGRRAMCDKEE